MEELLKLIHHHIREMEYIKYTLHSLIYWDKITYMPPKAIDYHSDVMGYLGKMLYEKLSNKEFLYLISSLESMNSKDPLIQGMLKQVRYNYSYINAIPNLEYQEYLKLISHAELTWEESKKKKDFAIFSPYVKKIVHHFKKFADYWGYEKHPYDALMGYYEQDARVESMDVFIEEMKETLIPLIRSKVDQPQKALLSKKTLGFHEKDQYSFSVKILEQTGFDFLRGRLDQSSHPTTLAFSPDDVRIVTSLDPEDVTVGIFNTLHEAGKGIYEQNIDKRLLGWLLAEVPSYGFQEAQARLYENIVGRSPLLWKTLYPLFQESFPPFKNIPLSGFLEHINRVEASPIRIEADELTYPLHIIIRYEIERDLIRGDIHVDDLPGVWNQKYEAYLGIRPKDDAEGVLQDIHWAAGYFGFFPSYLLSNIYASQLFHSIEKSFVTVEEDQQLLHIHRWLKENVNGWGAIYDSKDLIQHATGEKLNVRYYQDYLNKKYK